MPRSRTLPAATLICLMLALVGAPTADAQIIAPGVDVWETPSDGTYQDFAEDPLPAGFFGEGSLPWDGIIEFQGNPVDPSQPYDTEIERLGEAHVECGGPAAYVPLRLASLSLSSTSPISVGYAHGYSELWDVQAVADSDQSEGYAAFRKTCTDGGTFSSLVPVTPTLIFTRHSDGYVVTYIGAEIVFQNDSIGWVYDPAGKSTQVPGPSDTSLVQQVVAGVNMSSCDCVSPPARKYIRYANDEEERLARHRTRTPWWRVQTTSIQPHDADPHYTGDSGHDGDTQHPGHSNQDGDTQHSGQSKQGRDAQHSGHSNQDGDTWSTDHSNQDRDAQYIDHSNQDGDTPYRKGN